jgi:hypothetical protein
MSEFEAHQKVIKDIRALAERLKTELPEGYSFSMFLFKREGDAATSVYNFASVQKANQLELITLYFSKEMPQQN